MSRASACLLATLPLALVATPALAAGPAPAEGPLLAERSPASAPAYRGATRQEMEATGARIGAGARRRISGPALTYQPGQGGPTIELASLGGKVDGAPKLLHLAFEWKF